MKRNISIALVLVMLFTSIGPVWAGTPRQKLAQPSQEVKFRGVIIQDPDLGVIGVDGWNVEIHQIVSDPRGNLKEGDTATVTWGVYPPWYEYSLIFDVGDRVEVYGAYHDIEDVPPWWSPDDLGDHWVNMEDEGRHYIEIVEDLIRVKFRGTAMCDEATTWRYCGNYFVDIEVKEILHDPQNELTVGQKFSVYYQDVHNFSAGDYLEVYGTSYLSGGPLQCVGSVVVGGELGSAGDYIKKCEVAEDVKFRGTVTQIFYPDYEVQIEEILSGDLNVGAYAWIDVWNDDLIIGSIEVGDFVEVYGECYNFDPERPGIHVNRDYHYIKEYRAPSITNISESNDPINRQGCPEPTTVTICADVTDDSPLSWVRLYYQPPGASLTYTTMTPESGNTYKATIGPFSQAGTLEYYVKARDSAGNEARSSTRTVTVNDCDTAPPSIRVEGGIEDYQPSVFFRGSEIHVKLENLPAGEHDFRFLLWEDHNDNLEVEEGTDYWIPHHIPSFTSDKQEFDKSLPEDCPIGLYRLEVEVDGTKYTSNNFFVIFNPNGDLPEQDLENYWRDEKTGERRIPGQAVGTSHHGEEVMVGMASAALSSPMLPKDRKKAMRIFQDWIDAHTAYYEGIGVPSDITYYIHQIKSGAKPPADCDGRSSLLVALARASGIPTRFIHGFGDDKDPKLFTLWSHAWVEAYYGGSWKVWDPAYDLEYGDNYKGYIDYHKEVRELADLWLVRDELWVDRGNDYPVAFTVKIRAELLSSANLHAYDSKGRHVGMNEQGKIELEIPNAYYTGPDSEPEEITIFGQSENIKFRVEALREGEFDLLIEQTTEAGTREISYQDVPIIETTEAWVNVSSENPEYLMDIDEDAVQWIIPGSLIKSPGHTLSTSPSS